MNIEALKLILKHFYKLPVNSFCTDNWVSPLEFEVNENLKGKELRNMLLASGIKFDAIGWAMQFKSINKLGLTAKDIRTPIHVDNELVSRNGSDAISEFLGITYTELNELFNVPKNCGEQLEALKKAIASAECTTDIDVDFINRTIDQDRDFSPKTCELILNEVNKVKKQFDAVLIVGFPFKLRLASPSVQYGCVIGDKKARFHNGAYIHTSVVNQVEAISENVNLLRTLNSTYLEISIG